ncbi:MAG: Rieske (2Fe-2S) protein [Deltaproteobacteria bacterium]|nr:Rieske (2Fe-2S) protein [Deltaproteobacteria bacterium]
MKKPEVFPVALASERVLDRRRFLCAAGGAAVLALAGEWGAKRAEEGSQAEALALQLDETPLAVGEARTVTATGGAEALVVQVDASTLVGFDRRCPHLGCPVLWVKEHTRFECPCHHAAFDARSGEVLFGPPRHGLRPARLVTKARKV